MITNVSIKRLVNKNVTVIISYSRNESVRFNFLHADVEKVGLNQEIQERAVDYRLSAKRTDCSDARKNYELKAALLNELVCLMQDRAQRDSGM